MRMVIINLLSARNEQQGVSGLSARHCSHCFQCTLAKADIECRAEYVVDFCLAVLVFKHRFFFFVCQRMGKASNKQAKVLNLLMNENYYQLTLAKVMRMVIINLHSAGNKQ
ncbi:hypothetical protein L6J37_15520 [Photobacterium sp. WH77]|uniref:hypothetical protein n=1 Tax=Photobacterium TaxID=657 RepID=UPI001C49689B|nr:MULTISPECIES: hypothetical protein [Photobacterium]MBV7263568.1 hypothetical protein [Photobacterium sp. WH24]MCG2838242.1 hypothetical protein [Photobacterium sp. WH77]MCG2845859.1 hypothetical protein [Photobacterium sp. WH80]MDO6582444.1 hypothetical protein [Photobacterium sp. 2_MG-2023]